VICLIQGLGFGLGVIPSNFERVTKIKTFSQSDPLCMGRSIGSNRKVYPLHTLDL
jgi:hypothetical protein